MTQPFWATVKQTLIAPMSAGCGRRQRVLKQAGPASAAVCPAGGGGGPPTPRSRLRGSRLESATWQVTRENQNSKCLTGLEKPPRTIWKPQRGGQRLTGCLGPVWGLGPDPSPDREGFCLATSATGIVHRREEKEQRISSSTDPTPVKSSSFKTF